MTIVRVTAVLQEGGHSNVNTRFVLLCGINANHQIEDGEWWMGYIKDQSEFHPFILMNGSCFYGYEEHYFEPTDIGDCHHLIQVDGFFTLFSPPQAEEPWRSTFKIISCDVYQG